MKTIRHYLLSLSLTALACLSLSSCEEDEYHRYAPGVDPDLVGIWETTPDYYDRLTLCFRDNGTGWSDVNGRTEDFDYECDRDVLILYYYVGGGHYDAEYYYYRFYRYGLYLYDYYRPDVEVAYLRRRR